MNIIPSKDFKTLSIVEFVEKYKNNNLNKALVERCIFFQYKYRETTDNLNHIKKVINHIQSNIKIPRVLESIDSIHQFKYKDLRCVYFLMKRQKVVYIGQSMCLSSRIKAHLSENTKDFDKIFYMIVKKDYLLDAVERQYI